MHTCALSPCLPASASCLVAWMFSLTDFSWECIRTGLQNFWVFLSYTKLLIMQTFWDFLMLCHTSFVHCQKDVSSYRSTRHAVFRWIWQMWPTPVCKMNKKSRCTNIRYVHIMPVCFFPTVVVRNGISLSKLRICWIISPVFYHVDPTSCMLETR